METPSSTPLSDIWAAYSESLGSSIESGEIEDQAIAEIYVWPRDLEITLIEREDIKRYVHERLSEILARHQHHGHPIDHAIIASYIFRTLICGMMLARQKEVNKDA